MVLWWKQDLLAALLQDRAVALFSKPQASTFSTATRLWARLKSAIMLAAVLATLPASLLLVAASIASAWLRLLMHGDGAEVSRRLRVALGREVHRAGLRGTAIVSGGDWCHACASSNLPLRMKLPSSCKVDSMQVHMLDTDLVLCDRSKEHKGATHVPAPAPQRVARRACGRPKVRLVSDHARRIARMHMHGVRCWAGSSANYGKVTRNWAAGARWSGCVAAFRTYPVPNKDPLGYLKVQALCLARPHASCAMDCVAAQDSDKVYN